MKKSALVFAMASLLLSGCAKKAAPHVIIFGLDGWGSFSMEEADIPNIRSLMSGGTYTLEKRTMQPSHSATNWASMFTGVGPQIHGFTSCCSPKPDIEPIYKTEYGVFPTIFRELRNQRPEAEIGTLYDWKGLGAVLDTLSFSFREIYPGDEAALVPATGKACDYVKASKPDLMLMYYGITDHTGHSEGFGAPEYYRILNVVDESIGKIIQATKDAGIYDDCVFVVTSDHGGIGKGHGGINTREMYTPLVICGKGIANKGDLGKPIVQVDQAPTLARILGIKLTQDVWGRCVEDYFE